MTSGGFRFESFLLDPDNRRLRNGEATVELNARYFDALTLLVREHGKLVTKERFLEEVWRGVPVTDEALSQCIKTLRRQLGDDAARPRFIETVPKHGYRFVATVEWIGADTPHPAAALPSRVWREPLHVGAAGAAGGAAAGLAGGLIYSALGVAQPGLGAASAMLVLMGLTTLVGMLGGAGVGLGVGAAVFAPNRQGQWEALGAGAGGLVVGGLVKLIGIDTFNLLFGHAPADITGAAEGALLGGAVGVAAWLARGASLRRSLAIAAAAGAAAGIIIHLLGGRLMAGSLDVLARAFPGSRLRFDRIGSLFGESEFGDLSQAVICSLEAALFTLCLVAAIRMARQRLYLR